MKCYEWLDEKLFLHSCLIILLFFPLLQGIENISIPYKDKFISAIYNKPAGEGNGYMIILTHGLGGNMNNYQINLIAKHQAEKGYFAVRFASNTGCTKTLADIYHAVLVRKYDDVLVLYDFVYSIHVPILTIFPLLFILFN